MTGRTYLTAEGEELDTLDRGMRIAAARRKIARFVDVRRQADEALAALEDELNDLRLAHRL